MDGSVALLIKQRNFPGTAQCLSNWTDHSCQRIKLVGERHLIRVVVRELALADHVHEINADEHGTGGSELFEVEHRPGHPFDGAVVLFDDVIKSV